MKHWRKIFWITLVGLAGWMTVTVVSNYKNRTFREGERFTVVSFIKGEVKVESIDPQTRQGIRLVLPGEMELITTGGKGTWTISVLGEMADKFGRKWAADSVADSLGISYTLNYWGGRPDRGDWWDFGRWMILSRQAKWQEVDMKTNGWLTEKIAADGVKTWKLNEKWYADSRDYFASMGMISEGWSATVVNTTETPGLGAHVARVLESGGVKVEAVKNQTPEAEECILEVNTGGQVFVTPLWVAKVFDCQLRENEQVGEKELVLSVGKEYDLWWRGKD